MNDINEMVISKDERIRKAIIDIIKSQKEQQCHIDSAIYDEMISWLEKIEPKFKVGDWVVNKLGDLWHIDSLDKKNYQVSDGKGNYNYFPISKQDEMRLWTIQDVNKNKPKFHRGEWITNGEYIWQIDEVKTENYLLIDSEYTLFAEEIAKIDSEFHLLT